MLAAAAAWDTLAAELQSTVSLYTSAISTLASGPWIGPSSVAMTAAVAPYVTWLSATAAQAKETAMQANAAASAYEAAFAAHVPPPVIAANRSQLATLVATNLFGQNTSAIAAAEAQYAEFWAQDASAMNGYVSSSAAASQVSAFTEPPQMTNAGGLAGQAAVVGQAAGGAAATDLQSLLGAADPISTLLQWGANLATAYNTAVPQLINALFGPTAATTYTSLYNAIKTPLGFTTGFNDIGLLVNFPASQFLKFATKPGLLGELPKDALGGGLGVAGPNWGRGWLTSSVNPVAADLGRGTLVGKLMVPPSWAPATPGIRMVAAALSAGADAVPAAALSEGSLLSAMSTAGMLGSAFGAGAPDAYASAGVRGRLTKIKDLKDKHSPEQLKRLVAQISEKPESVQHHNVDQEGLDSLLEQLSKKPGIHAVHLTKGDKSKVLPSDASLG